MSRKWQNEAEKQSFFLTHKLDRAVEQHGLIADGDRILVGVSGGKDSMGLLRLLNYGLASSPAKYEVFAAHVRGDARGSEIDIPQPFLDWLGSQGVPVIIRDIHLPDDEPLPMDCERCSRNRRRTLFEIAEETGCNKVALGHNLEDFAHTALINLFSSGKLETMAFRRSYFGGKFTVIRPLALVREHELVRYAKACEFPIYHSDCPWAGTSRRQAARDLMRQVTREFRQAGNNVLRAAGTVGEKR